MVERLGNFVGDVKDLAESALGLDGISIARKNRRSAGNAAELHRATQNLMDAYANATIRILAHGAILGLIANIALSQTR